jgi:hypothetical protein
MESVDRYSFRKGYQAHKTPKVYPLGPIGREDGLDPVPPGLFEGSFSSFKLLSIKRQVIPKRKAPNGSGW